MSISKVTQIDDRYEMTFLIFYRDNNQEGPIYHEPSQLARKMYAEAMRNLHQQGRVQIRSFKDNPHVYKFMISHPKPKKVRVKSKKVKKND